MPPRRVALAFAAFACAAITARADGAAFDLTGPEVMVTVSRGDMTLPIDEVPGLAAHDVLALRADLPANQSAHYLLVLAFLRGSTNPPPRDWFHPCETWRMPCAGAGLRVEVPEGAQQALILLAPSTAGDLRTMIDAVTGRPGAFVRASQVLRQAALDRSRLDTYLTALGAVDGAARAHLGDAARLLARSLALKIDSSCLDDAPEAQAACLMKGQDSLVLNDGHSATLVDALTSGPSADLALVAASTPALGSGYYGPYVASLLNVGKLVSHMRSAHFQYLPALAVASAKRLKLTLNSPPSFHEPFSVLVATLPAVVKSRPPPMRAAAPGAQYCAYREPLVLAVEGAPLAFSTRYAHDMRLRVETGVGVREAPARADAVRGGYVVERAVLPPGAAGGSMRARLHGMWGFDDFEGPQFNLVGVDPAHEWGRGADDGLVAGRESVMHLKGAGIDCIASVSATDTTGAGVPVQWKASGEDEVELRLSLQDATPGELNLRVTRLGAAEPVTLNLPVFPDTIRVRSIAISASDAAGVIRGTHLEPVKSVQIDRVEFVPGPLLRLPDGEERTIAPAEAGTKLALPAAARRARVMLQDGRRLDAAVTMAPARPMGTLLEKTVEHVPHGDRIPILLDGNDAAAPDESIRFSVHVDPRTPLGRESALDVATQDGQFYARLVAGQGLTLASAQTAIASFTPLALLGPQAYGPLKFRIDNGGVPGDWQELVRLVRLPDLLTVDCASVTVASCRIDGRNLFLLARIGVGVGARPAHQVEVPEGYTGASVTVPGSAATALYYALADDPGIVRRIELLPRRHAVSAHAP